MGQTDEQEVVKQQEGDRRGNNVDRNPELDIGVLRWLLNTEVSREDLVPVKTGGRNYVC